MKNGYAEPDGYIVYDYTTVPDCINVFDLYHCALLSMGTRQTTNPHLSVASANAVKSCEDHCCTQNLLASAMAHSWT